MPTNIHFSFSKNHQFKYILNTVLKEIVGQGNLTGPKMDSASTKLLTFSARLQSTIPKQETKEIKMEIQVKETIVAILDIH